MHVGHAAILMGNAECVLGMAGLIGEGCASEAPQSIISYRHGSQIRIISWTAWHSGGGSYRLQEQDSGCIQWRQ